MRISYQNLLKTSAMTASYEDANYPVENVYHKWQRKTFKGTGVSLTITAVLDDVVNVTSVGIDYHNLVTCRVILYDATDTIIEDIANIIVGNCSFTYGTWVDVAKVTFVCTSIVNVEIGTLFVGDSIYSEIESDQDIPLKTSDVVTYSSDRQTSGRKGTVTRAGTITIPLLSSTERKAIETVFYDMGYIEPFFIDLWDSSHASFEPLYGTFTSEISVTHKEEGDTISFSFEEAN